MAFQNIPRANVKQMKVPLAAGFVSRSDMLSREVAPMAKDDPDERRFMRDHHWMLLKFKDQQKFKVFGMLATSLTRKAFVHYTHSGMDWFRFRAVFERKFTQRRNQAANDGELGQNWRDYAPWWDLDISVVPDYELVLFIGYGCNKPRLEVLIPGRKPRLASGKYAD